MQKIIPRDNIRYEPCQFHAVSWLNDAMESAVNIRGSQEITNPESQSAEVWQGPELFLLKTYLFKI